MAIGKQNPREPRDFYHLFRPNTSIWLGRIVAIMPWLYFPIKIMFDKLGLKTNIDDVNGSILMVYLTPLLLQFILVFGMISSASLRAGIFQHTDRKHLDEFELRLIEKARLFSYRILSIILLLSLPLLATEGPLYQLIDGLHIQALSFGIFISLMILITLPPAYFHWSLKLVPSEENIRPDPPFVPNDYVGMTYWQRFWRR